MSSTCGESQIKKHQISSSLISHRQRWCCCVVVVDATLMVLLLLLLLILRVLLELNGYWCCWNVHGGDAIEYFLSVVVSVVLLLRCCHKDLWYLNHNLIFSRFRFLHRNRCCCCYQCYVFNSWYLLIVVALNALCEPLLMLLFCRSTDDYLIIFFPSSTYLRLLLKVSFQSNWAIAALKSKQSGVHNISPQLPF